MTSKINHFCPIFEQRSHSKRLSHTRKTTFFHVFRRHFRYCTLLHFTSALFLHHDSPSFFSHPKARKIGFYILFLSAGENGLFFAWGKENRIMVLLYYCPHFPCCCNASLRTQKHQRKRENGLLCMLRTNMYPPLKHRLNAAARPRLEIAARFLLPVLI